MAQNYEQYKRGVKKLGAKQIATREEFAVIQKRLDKIYKSRSKTKRPKETAASLLVNYARRSGYRQ